MLNVTAARLAYFVRGTDRKISHAILSMLLLDLIQEVKLSLG